MRYQEQKTKKKIVSFLQHNFWWAHVIIRYSDGPDVYEVPTDTDWPGDRQQILISSQNLFSHFISWILRKFPQQIKAKRTFAFYVVSISSGDWPICRILKYKYLLVYSQLLKTSLKPRKRGQR